MKNRNKYRETGSGQERKREGGEEKRGKGRRGEGKLIKEVHNK